MRELLFIALSAALINNFVLSYFMGICPFLGVSKRLDSALGMGAAVTFVMTISGGLTYLIQQYALIPLGLEILQYVAFIFVIAGTVQFVELYVQRFFEPLYRAFGVYLPMITTNCAVLGVCLLVWSKSYDTLTQALTFSCFGGAGFTLAIVIMAGLRESVDFADVPRPLRGTPIVLFVAAILAMAFAGFAGMGSQ
ncbi:MAG: electron transport complex protein RnfA [Planctomycetales bacterium]